MSVQIPSKTRGKTNMLEWEKYAGYLGVSCFSTTFSIATHLGLNRGEANSKEFGGIK